MDAKSEPKPARLPPICQSKRAVSPSVYQVLQDAIASRAFPGCAFGVFAGGNVVLDDALGRFTYDARLPRGQPRHRLRRCQHHQSGLHHRGCHAALSSAAFSIWICRWANCCPASSSGATAPALARQVTLRHLLAHNSGLPGYVEFFRTVTTPAALYRACLELPDRSRPRERSRILRPGIHSAWQGAGSPDHARLCARLGPEGDIRAARSDRNRLFALR